MERDHELLSRARLSVISAEPDHELDRIAERVTPSVRIGGRAELEALLERLLAASASAGTIAPKTLDLLGHSTARASLLRLGDWVIDAANPEVTAVFRGLADHGVLPRLGIGAVRLLGCTTAGTAHGRATIWTLSDLLGIEVHGSNHLLYEVHYDAQGFRDIWEFMLVSAQDLRRTASTPATPDAGQWPCTLELDALPASPLGPRAASWPQLVVTPRVAHQIVPLLRPGAGAPMPGVTATPSCELALPAATPGTYHVAEVLVRGRVPPVYPGGAAAPGVVYPVDDVHGLRRLVDELARAGVSR